MPSTSKKQADFMRAVAHSPEFAKKVGVPVSVGKEFTQEDKETDMKRYMKGGKMPSAPSLPSQASSKAASAMERFAGTGKRPGMAGGGVARGIKEFSKKEFAASGTPKSGMKGGGRTKRMMDGGSVPTSPPLTLRAQPYPYTPDKSATSIASTKKMPNFSRSFRNVPTLPDRASQRARDIMASRMPITTPGGPAEITPESTPLMPQVESMPGSYGLKMVGGNSIKPPPPQPQYIPSGPIKSPLGMNKGGRTGGKSRMDGCAMKGKTKGRMV